MADLAAHYARRVKPCQPGAVEIWLRKGRHEYASDLLLS
jgi:hypothetical protein